MFPSCERVGSFAVRGRAGINRIPFRGRVRGRPLPDGTYRLRVRPKGARADVAVVTVVIVNGKKMSAAELRKAQHATACRSAETTVATIGSAVGPGSNQSSSGDKSVLDRAKEPIVNVAEGLATKVRELPGRLGAATDDPFSDPFVLIIIGLLTLSTAALGTLLIAHVVRVSDTTDRTAR